MFTLVANIIISDERAKGERAYDTGLSYRINRVIKFN